MPRPVPNRIVAKLSDTIPFVAPEEFERRLGSKFLARLGANESVFGPSPLAAEAMARVAMEPQWYGDPISFDLRTKLASLLSCTIDNLVIGPGIDGLFSHIASAYLEPGDPVVTTLGSYPTFNYFINAVGARLVQVPYNNFGVDLEALLEAVRQSNAQAVYVANPDNPSGMFHGQAAIRQFLDELPENILVLLDEAYIEFVEPFELDDPRLIRLRTFSKVYGMAGARIAYAIGEPATVQPLNRIRPHFEVNAIAQAGALASLHDETFVANIRRRTREGKDELSGILQSFGFETPVSHTNFVLGNAGNRERAEDIVFRLRERRVFVRKPGAAPLDGFIRVTVGNPSDHKVFASALGEIVE